MKSPFIPQSRIAAEAEALIAGYSRKFGSIEQPPVPVEAIIEAYLGLHLGFDDLKSQYGLGDVLGCIKFETEEILVDLSLDPTLESGLTGRYRFTLGHEVGHWSLHRQYFIENQNQGLLDIEHDSKKIVCRDSQKEESREKQADLFSACLLMPTDLLRKIWQAEFGKNKVLKIPGGTLKKILAGNTTYPFSSSNEEIVCQAGKQMAGIFGVSRQAMLIRMNRTGILLAEEQGTML